MPSSGEDGFIDEVDPPAPVPSAAGAAAKPVRARTASASEAARDKARAAVEAAQDALADHEDGLAVLELKLTAVLEDADKAEWQRAEIRQTVAKALRAFKRAGKELTRAEARYDDAQAEVDAEHAALEEAGAEEEEEDDAPPPRFATVDLFVDQFVLPNWNHKYVRVLWCRKWWEHAEAITRLEALWEAFEVMRLQPAPSFSTWLRDHFDVHMRALTDPEGVFFSCDTNKEHHKPQEPWPSDPAPAGMFAVIESAQIQRALPTEGFVSAPADMNQNATSPQVRASESSRSGPITGHNSSTTSGVRR